MKLYEADAKWLKSKNLNGNDARRLFHALCALADYEGAIALALASTGGQHSDLSQTCEALRYLVDGPQSWQK